MTVEAVTKVPRRHGFLGLRTRMVEEAEVLEYRNAKLKYGNGYLSNPDRSSVMIKYGSEHDGEGLGPYTFARATDEDTVLVEQIQFTLSGAEVLETNVYKGQEINAADLKTEDGATNIRWRETQPGDYPKTTMIEGQEVKFTNPRVARSF